MIFARKDGRKFQPTRTMYGLGWAEGPVFCQNGDVVVTSMDQGSLFRISDAPQASRFVTGGFANAAAEDADGQLFITQEGGSWPATRVAGITGGVQVLSQDGAIHWVTQDPVSPNDLCFGPDGMLYVTDPTRHRPARDDGRIWRIDPSTGRARILTSVSWFPNGIAFDSENRLYVASTWDGTIRRYDVHEDEISAGETVLRIESGGPDGIAFDVEGKLLVCCVGLEAGTPGHIEVWCPDGELCDYIHLGPHRLYTNIALASGGRMAVTEAHDNGGVLLFTWDSPGLALYPFRG